MKCYIYKGERKEGAPTTNNSESTQNPTKPKHIHESDREFLRVESVKVKDILPKKDERTQSFERIKRHSRMIRRKRFDNEVSERMTRVMLGCGR